MKTLENATREELLDAIERLDNESKIRRVHIDEDFYVIDSRFKMLESIHKFVMENSRIIGDHESDVSAYFNYMQDCIDGERKHIKHVPSGMVFEERHEGSWTAENEPLLVDVVITEREMNTLDWTELS